MSAASEGRWLRGRLGDLLPLKYGKGLPEKSRDSSGSVPVFGSSGQVGRHSQPLTSGPTLIVGRKGTVGAVHLSPEPCWPIDTVYFAEAEEGQNLKYYRYLLDSLNLARLDRSTAVPGLSRDDYNAVEVTIAPPQDQERVVAEIEKQFSRLDEAIANLRRMKTNLNHYVDACLHSAFEFEALVPSPAIANLGEVAEAIVDCPHSTPRWTPEGFICVRTTDFLPGRLDLSAARYVSRDTFNQRNSRLAPRAGDVLYSREGGILGIACEVPIGVELCMGQRMLLFRAGPRVLSRYVMHLLNSRHTLKRVRALVGGSASPHLNVRDIRGFPVPVPALDMQRRIVSEVDRRLSIVREVEAEVDRNYQRAQALRQAVLRWAFAVEPEVQIAA